MENGHLKGMRTNIDALLMKKKMKRFFAKSLCM
jgi:hypothetical protein